MKYGNPNTFSLVAIGTFGLIVKAPDQFVMFSYLLQNPILTIDYLVASCARSKMLKQHCLLLLSIDVSVELPVLPPNLLL